MLLELELLESSWESSWKSPVKYLLDENGNQETAAEGRPALLPELCFFAGKFCWIPSWQPARYINFIGDTISSKRS